MIAATVPLVMVLSVGRPDESREAVARPKNRARETAVVVGSSFTTHGT